MAVKDIDTIAILGAVVFLLPLFIFFFLISLGRVINRYRGILATTVMFICTCLSFYIYSNTWQGEAHHLQFHWFSILDVVNLSFGIYLDDISSLLVLIVTIVSFLVHLFSIEYLRGDKHFEKYFSYLGLFTFAMLGILLADNLFQIFVFWELVGLSSYLLIGFYYQKESAVYANKKAFIVNRVGDLGFLLAILIFYSLYQTFDLKELVATVRFNNPWVIVAGLGLFLGSVGKSAQFPLNVWLPNAMEGPTPVSALIHAATMVAAGVYLLARVYGLLDEQVLCVIAVIGTITAVIGAFSAIAQTDIKRVLAFSTISQLGYMVMGMGIKAYDAALMHLVTHAFFKACLFLSAGAVIHSLHKMEQELNIPKGLLDTQDMRFMGGLRKKKPVTFICFTISALSLAGLPLFSGFLSKDAIVATAFEWASQHGTIYYLIPIVAVLTGFLTAYYVGRQLFLVFGGNFRFPIVFPQYKDSFHYLIKTPTIMRIPIVILGFLSLFIVFSWNPFSLDHSWFMVRIQYLKAEYILNGHHWHWLTTILSSLMAFSGLGLAYYIFSAKRNDQDIIHLTGKTVVGQLSTHNFFLDKIYHHFIVLPFLSKARWVQRIDHLFVDNLVNGTGNLSLSLGRFINRFDVKIVDGFVQFIGLITAIKSMMVAAVDRYIVDGVVNTTAKTVGVIGSIIRGTQAGKVQLYIAYTLLLLLTICVTLIGIRLI